MAPLLPELRLAAACCRWPPGPSRDEAVRDAAGEAIDWPLFVRIAQRHRVDALVHEALRQASPPMPAESKAALAGAAMRIAQQNMALAAESARIDRLFGAAGIPLLFIKGLSLAVISYGSISLKMGRDIDILVRPEMTGAAAALLTGAGYRRTIPGPEYDAQQLIDWHAHWKESEWQHDSRDVVVELHTALVDSPMLLRGVGMDSPRQMVEIARGISLPTLPRDELFAYLCVHGASSGWSRLKWIADIGALLAAGGIEETDRLYARSQDLGAGRAAAQALLLCHTLLDTAIGAPLMNRLRADWRNRYLVRAALRVMSGRDAAREVHESRLGTIPIHLMQFLLLPGWRFKLSELRRQAVSPYDRIAIPLPQPLHFLYPIMRLPNWVRRKRRERAGG